MIRVIVVDDHPALRAGLRTVLDSEPGISYAGETVLKVEADISLSEDPSLRFRFAPKAGGELRAEIEDSSDRRFSDAWPVAAPTM